MDDRQTHTKLKHTARHHARGRRGFILILVLGLTVVVTTLGISFLESNSTAMPEAVNRAAAARARYLAESGIALGTRYLMHPPSTVAPGGYWTGGTGIAIDATSDYTNVVIAQDAVDPKLFTIAAMGIVKDPDGAIRGKRSSAAQVIVPDDGKWHIPYAILGSSMTIPATVTVQGDIHANGTLLGFGNCTGNVSASGLANWMGTGPPASVTSGAAQYARPQADPTLYATYNIRGTSYTADTSLGGYFLNSSAASSLNAIDMSATNPGRIIMAPAGDFELRKNVQLIGTLVVQGNLMLSDGVQVTALAGYPALVVTGDIVFWSGNMAATVLGSVICGGIINDGGYNNLTLSVTGAFVTGNGFNIFNSSGAYVLTWDRNLATFWDFRKSSEQFPITILNWKED